MRKLFIAAGILIFLVYCWASVALQNVVDVPRYRDVEIDLLDGASREAWDADPQSRFQRLMNLETLRCQRPEGEPGADNPLSSGDFEKHIAAHPGSPVMMKLRDSGEFTALLAQKFLLRDPVPDPADGADNPDARILYSGGTPLNKAMLDDLNSRGVLTVTVTGHAAPVRFQLGTAVMIAVIFFTLVAALMPILWTPFIAMLEKRRRELDAGAEAERQNQQEAVRLQEETRRRNMEMGLRANEERMRGRRETAKEAGAVVRDARDREKEVKLSGLRDIGLAAEHARREMENQIPELAGRIADAVMPSGGKK